MLDVPRVVMFVHEEVGHLQRLMPLMQGLRCRGARVDVFTHRCLRADVESTGARFVDLFDGCPQEAADAASLPTACRAVAFAGCYAEEIAARLAPDPPALIVHDTFAVIGHVVGRLMGVPYVNVCAGHDVQPAPFVAALQAEPRVRVSPECHAMVARLRERHGIAEASPFFYAAALSPLLNVYCEPPEFLPAHARRTFEPLAFFGSLSGTEVPVRRAPGEPSCFGAANGEQKVYVSFGTVVWRYYAREALAALRVIAEELSSRADTLTILSLGGHAFSDATLQPLRLPRVQLVSRVAQRDVLADADVFITHHGLNSTHEAIYHRVPMLSYPFFWDQPALARRCRTLGIAVPLAESPRAPLQRADVARALREVTERGFLQPALQTARAWELAVMAGRERILDRLLELAAGTPA